MYIPIDGLTGLEIANKLKQFYKQGDIETICDIIIQLPVNTSIYIEEYNGTYTIEKINDTFMCWSVQEPPCYDFTLLSDYATAKKIYELKYVKSVDVKFK